MQDGRWVDLIQSGLQAQKPPCKQNSSCIPCEGINHLPITTYQHQHRNKAHVSTYLGVTRALSLVYQSWLTSLTSLLAHSEEMPNACGSTYGSTLCYARKLTSSTTECFYGAWLRGRVLVRQSFGEPDTSH